MTRPLTPFCSTQQQNTKIEPISARKLLHLAPPSPNCLLPMARSGLDPGPDRLWKWPCPIFFIIGNFFMFWPCWGRPKPMTRSSQGPGPGPNRLWKRPCLIFFIIGKCFYVLAGFRAARGLWPGRIGRPRAKIKNYFMLLFFLTALARG